MSDLTKLSEAKPGDYISVNIEHKGHMATISGELWEGMSGLYLADVRILIGSGVVADHVTRLDYYRKARKLIERGDVINSADDVDLFEIPDKTIFRTRNEDTYTFRANNTTFFKRDVNNHQPLRCVSVVGHDD